MTYSTQDLDRLSTGESAYSASVNTAARNARRRRHAHIMHNHAGGARLSGFGI